MLSSLLPILQYKFDIKRAQQVNRMALLDAENLNSAALIQPTPQTAPNGVSKQLQKLDNRVTPL